MKILFIHADYVNYEAKEEGPAAEEISGVRKMESMEDPLIVFASVEERDEDSGEREVLAGKALEEIEDIASKIKTENIALFPFAHLSESLASPNFAISVLEKLESKLEVSDFNSFRAPFGWYKEFEFRSKGHPLSVLSRTIIS